MTYFCTDIPVLDAIQAIAKRPNMYFGSRKELIAFMWGYTIGRVNGIPVPGPDFKQFEVDMDSPPTSEWAKPVVEYVRTCVGERT